MSGFTISNHGLDASITRGFIESINKFEAAGHYGISRVSAIAIPELAVLDGLTHVRQGLWGITASVAASGGRLVGLDSSKESSYNMKREALHLMRALAFFGAALQDCFVLPFVMFYGPSSVERVHDRFGLNTPWEKVEKVANWKERFLELPGRMVQEHPRLVKALAYTSFGLLGASAAGAAWWWGSPAEVVEQPVDNPDLTHIVEDAKLDQNLNQLLEQPDAHQSLANVNELKDLSALEENDASASAIVSYAPWAATAFTAVSAVVGLTFLIRKCRQPTKVSKECREYVQARRAEQKAKDDLLRKKIMETLNG